jgi:hypothetical protein
VLYVVQNCCKKNSSFNSTTLCQIENSVIKSLLNFIARTNSAAASTE